MLKKKVVRSSSLIYTLPKFKGLGQKEELSTQSNLSAGFHGASTDTLAIPLELIVEV